MAARLHETVPSAFPLRHGMLCASGLTLESDHPVDAFDALIAGRGELTLVLLSLKSPVPRRSEVDEALAAVRGAVLSGLPIYEVIAAVRAWTTLKRERSLGLTLIRFSQPDSRVEILNAGMPAVACALPGGRVALHAALSLPIGERFGEVHPYELCPLVWGSAWFAMSRGLTADSIEPEAARSAIVGRDLHRFGAELAAGPPASLSPWIERLAAGSRNALDASLVLAHADPTRRFESGIRS